MCTILYIDLKRKTNHFLTIYTSNYNDRYDNYIVIVDEIRNVTHLGQKTFMILFCRKPRI